MSISRVQVRVPASTSNLGPGFDCLGLAVQLYNVTMVTRADNEKISHHGMITETARAFFAATGGRVKPFGFEAKIEGDVPVSRGLGSSVTVRLGILLGLAALTHELTPMTREEILRILIELEGHPDNAVASCLGGLAICAPASENRADGFVHSRVEVKPELTLVTLVPEMKLSTERARALLPREISVRQAVENAQRTARIVAGFSSGDYASLRGMFVDHVHQPFRRVLIPGFDAILAAARDAGALGSFLSGAGSCLMALTLENVEAISAAMLEAAKKNDLPARILVLKADNDGAKVLQQF